MATAPVTFPVLSPAEAAQLAVPFEEIHSKLVAVLEEHGVAIVPDLLSILECTEMEALFRSDLGKLLALPEEHPPPLSAWPWPCPELGDRGFALDRGLSQGSLAWAVRLHPRVRAVYAALHACAPEALCTSTDVIFYTPHAAPPADSTAQLWPHVDQNCHSERMGSEPVYQGAVYIWPSSAPGASTTVVWPRSQGAPYARLMEDANIAATGCMGAHYSPVRVCVGGCPYIL
jgi:hypothetical protein